MKAQGFEAREQLTSSSKLMNVGGVDHDIKDDAKALSIVVLGASGTCVVLLRHWIEMRDERAHG
jgi:hypothetical protein